VHLLALQIGSIARRTIVRTARQPAMWIAPVTFPLAVMLANSGGLSAATSLPGFPADSFYAFMLAAPFVHGALFSTMNLGTDLARDIQFGFLNRLALTPMRGVALVAGLLAGTVVLGVFQAIAYLATGLAIGVDIESGVPGVLVLLVYAALVSLAFGAIGAWMALRTGSGEAVQGLFPALFVFLFMSSMNMPRNLIEQEWFRTIATLNPISYLIEGLRSLIITGWDVQALALGFGFLLAITAASMALAARALPRRMERT
jgi:ABC-2 type transport system permease protein